MRPKKEKRKGLNENKTTEKNSTTCRDAMNRCKYPGIIHCSHKESNSQFSLIFRVFSICFILLFTLDGDR